MRSDWKKLQTKRYVIADPWGSEIKKGRNLNKQNQL